MHEQATPPTPARRAALYLRIGSIAEVSESDLEMLQSYARQSGYQIVETYRDEGKSGRDLNRPALARLRADAAQGRFDVVLVAHRTRLASTEVDSHAIIEELRGHGVAVESLADDIP